MPNELVSGVVVTTALKEPDSQPCIGSRGKRRILFVVNVGWFFTSHRLPVALAARSAGFDVHVATSLDPSLDRDTEAQLLQHGLQFHPLRFSRSGSRPLELVRDFMDLLRLFANVRPHIVHLVTLKPLLLGGLAARVSSIANVVLAVPGRGLVFSAGGLLAKLRQWTALALYRLAYRRGANRVVLQNPEDRQYFVARCVFAERDIRVIRGSGVDLNHFIPCAEAPGVPVIVCASRMLKAKGIADFVAAATLAKGRRIAARFVLVGAPDAGNPQSHTKEELERWARDGSVEWWGFRSDMRTVFAECHVACLPTFYGEGVPKVLIEAAACGRPIVATDMPGCREIVRNGDSGFLVKPRDPLALMTALEKLACDRDLRLRMGQRARALAVGQFSVQTVIRETLAVYNEFGL